MSYTNITSQDAKKNVDPSLKPWQAPTMEFLSNDLIKSGVYSSYPEGVPTFFGFGVGGGS